MPPSLAMRSMLGVSPDHQAAVITARLHPADVVAHDEQDVRFLVLRLASVANDIAINASATGRINLNENFAGFIESKLQVLGLEYDIGPWSYLEPRHSQFTRGDPIQRVSATEPLITFRASASKRGSPRSASSLRSILILPKTPVSKGARSS